VLVTVAIVIVLLAAVLWRARQAGRFVPPPGPGIVLRQARAPRGAAAERRQHQVREIDLTRIAPFALQNRD
jgi:hypothetical protein